MSLTLGTGKRGHIVAHDVFWAAQTWKHLLQTQNVSEQNQEYLLCPGHKSCLRNKCCACGQTGKHLCRQQYVRNNVSSFASTFSLNSLNKEVLIFHVNLVSLSANLKV